MSTIEVEAVLSSVLDQQDAIVYGVEVRATFFLVRNREIGKYTWNNFIACILQERVVV